MKRMYIIALATLLLGQMVTRHQALAQSCTDIVSDGETLGLVSVIETYPTWTTWGFIKAGIAEATRQEAAGILVHQVTQGEDGAHRVWRFSIDEHSDLVYATVPKSSNLLVGDCWNKVKTLTNVTAGEHVFDSVTFYLLQEQEIE